MGCGEGMVAEMISMADVIQDVNLMHSSPLEGRLTGLDKLGIQ